MKRLAVSFVVLVSALVAPAASHAAFPVAANGRIVFDRQLPGSTEFFFANPDGSGLVSPSSALSGNDASPSLSANGKRISFSHDVNPDPLTFVGNIFVMNSDGTGAVNLTSSAQGEGGPRFSPDAKRILFQRSLPMSANSEVFLIGADGSNPLLLAGGAPGIRTSDDFSADGKRVLITADSDPAMAVNLDIFVANVDGSGLTNLTPGSPDIDQSARFSPDGTKIAFNRRGNFQPADLMVMNADGSGVKNLTNTPAIDEFAPVYSPDGTKIAFSRADTGQDVYVINPDGSGQAPMIAGPADDSPSDWEPVYKCAGRRATIVGSDAAERLKGTKRADVIVANAGNDRVAGRGGNDRICGGKGKDKLSGGKGRDRMLGGPGKDRLSGGPGNDKSKQ
jgi:Tol biopolymer transport system component